MNEAWVAEQKAAHDPTGGVPYVSTSDVLASWFFQRGKYDCGMMLLNFRNLVHDLKNTDAGNYWDPLLLTPERFPDRA